MVSRVLRVTSTFFDGNCAEKGNNNNKYSFFPSRYFPSMTRKHYGNDFFFILFFPSLFAYITRGNRYFSL